VRNIWKGSISFGMVNIPVKLYPASEPKNVKFQQLHAVCQTPLKHERKCPQCNREVPMEEVVRGYEYEKNKYVVLQEEEFDNLPVMTTRTIDLVNFTDLNEIDPIYFSRAYFLTPNAGGQKAYKLLYQVLKDTNKVAIGKITIRSKESLVVLRTYQNSVLMETMFYPDEIRHVEELSELRYDVQLTEDEIKMATMLVEHLTAPFIPDKYHDRYREALMQVIQQKIEGQEIIIPAAVASTKVVDLMEALKASVALAEAEEQNTKKAMRRKKQAF
jgi:DNA end-binding protein Ku